MAPSHDRSLRRCLVGLTLLAALVVAGALVDSLWLIGIGAWVLIGAFLTELTYRP
ncbi:hypothetical protein ACWDZ6_21625 [Streptomyces sp. NPDC002926]